MRVSALGVAAAVAALATAPALAAQDVEKTYDFSDFDRISISGVYQVDVEVGEPFSIVLSGPVDEMDRVEVGLKGTTLRLGQRDRFGDRRHKNDGVEARIKLPDLRGLHMSGVVDGEVRQISGEAFEVAISGVGEMRLHGECNRLHAEVSGVGELDGESLQCKDVKVVVSGVGEATVYALDAVDAVVSGMGDITVYGSPKKVKKSGGMFADIAVK